MAKRAFRVIDEKGRRTTKKKIAEHPSTWLLELYRVMLLSRRFDELGSPLLPARGAEAVTLGTTAALAPGDLVFASQRSAAAALLRGVPLDTLVRDGLGTSREAGVVPLSTPNGNHVTHAIGAARAARLQGRDDIAAVFFGHGTVGLPAFHDALEFAAVLGGPVLMVCENGGDDDLAGFVGAWSLDVDCVDGGDVLAVHHVIEKAAAKARDGGGPTFIDARCARDGQVDPVERFRLHLVGAGVLTDELGHEMETAVAAEAGA